MGKGKQKLQWRCHTPNLLQEIHSLPGSFALNIPLNIFGKMLFAVGERAAQLNDPKLNALMGRLTIYACCDPNSPDYDAAQEAELMAWDFTDERVDHG